MSLFTDPDEKPPTLTERVVAWVIVALFAAGLTCVAWGIAVSELP